VEIDGQGRIRIPQLLRDLAGLKKDIVIHSVLHRIEIWDRETWDERLRQTLARRSSASGRPGGHR
jgi:MraZ protein